MVRAVYEHIFLFLRLADCEGIFEFDTKTCVGLKSATAPLIKKVMQKSKFIRNSHVVLCHTTSLARPQGGKKSAS